MKSPVKSIAPADNQSRSMRSAWIEIPVELKRTKHPASRSMRSAWIEIMILQTVPQVCPRRAPCGARGLKSAWPARKLLRRGRRAPCGARGLKLSVMEDAASEARRAPCGARGLKYIRFGQIGIPPSRAPCGARGLKSDAEKQYRKRDCVALHAERVD